YLITPQPKDNLFPYTTLFRSISGTMIKVDDLANVLQVCLDSGAKKILLPITSAGDLGSVPAELMGSFNIIFYNSAEDAVFKALGDRKSTRLNSSNVSISYTVC